VNPNPIKAPPSHRVAHFLIIISTHPCRQPPEMSTTATAAATNGTKRAREEEVIDLGAVDAVLGEKIRNMLATAKEAAAEKETPTEAEQQTPKKAIIDSSSPVCPPAPQKKKQKKAAAAEKEEVVDADYKKFAVLSDDATEAGRQYRTLTAEKKHLQDRLLDDLNEKKLTTIRVGDLSFSKKVSSRKNLLSMSVVKEVLLKRFPEDMVAEMVAEIEANKGTTDTVSILVSE
jgi:ribosomal protein S18